ncbi:MAG: endonuclease/exonuclease/phosphatase family protein [Deltaproteobacteria bacterium]|nr:endonuclease/exonuclease/phosphatase family protein [Deltaproteobacteria bacterium]
MRHLSPLLLALLLCGCSHDNTPPASDAASDAATDAATDSLHPGGDAASDTATHADAIAETRNDTLGVDLIIADAFIDPGTPIAVDGLFDDWAGIATRAVDPEGDATGAFDLTRVYAVSRGTTVFLRFSHGAAKNLNSGPDTEGTLAIEMKVQNASSLKIDLRARTISRDGSSSHPLRWSEVSYRAMPTAAARESELRIDLATIGATVGSDVTIRFSGSDMLTAPVSLRLNLPAQPTQRRDPKRSSEAAFRVLTLNTYEDGLDDSLRLPTFTRLFSSIDADIVCLQEETYTTSQTIMSAFPPAGAGQSWNILRSGTRDTAIVSRWPLIALPGGSRFVGAGIDLPSGEALVVYSFHPNCCGYIGSDEDTWRIAQSQELADAIARVRRGALGVSYTRFANAPVIIGGDWNLVGSNEPLLRLTTNDGPALTHWLLRHLVGDDIYTWRSDTSRYPPGMLDLVLFDATQLTRDKGFIFDSNQLDGARLLEMGLEKDDSAVTDHLALVTDFRLP